MGRVEGGTERIQHPIAGAGGENHGLIVIGSYRHCQRAGELVTARVNSKVPPSSVVRLNQGKSMIFCIRQGQNPLAAPMLGWIWPIRRQQTQEEGQKEANPCASSSLVLGN